MICKINAAILSFGTTLVTMTVPVSVRDQSGSVITSTFYNHGGGITELYRYNEDVGTPIVSADVISRILGGAQADVAEQYPDQAFRVVQAIQKWRSLHDARLDSIRARIVTLLMWRGSLPIPLSSGASLVIGTYASAGATFMDELDQREMAYPLTIWRGGNTASLPIVVWDEELKTGARVRRTNRDLAEMRRAAGAIEALLGTYVHPLAGLIDDICIATGWALGE